MNKKKPYVFQVEFWGRQYGGVVVSAFNNEFEMNTEEEEHAAEEFKSSVTSNQKELEELLMEFFFMDMNPEYRNEQSVIDEFKPDYLLVRDDGDYVLWGFGYEFGDEGFALVVGSHFEVAKQSEYLMRR